MNDIAVVGLVALILVNILGVIWVRRGMKNKFIPPVIDTNEPEAVNGITIGRYYGDPVNKVCVEVVAVENDMVAFRYMDPSNINTILSISKEGFLEKYYKYPNGCDFLTIEDDIKL